jgi:dihydroorotate dehydrogenase (fumarate)
MEMKTTYLGLELANPFMPGACPLADDLGTAKRLEDAGAAALVMRSLFEEQVVREEQAVHKAMTEPSGGSAEALNYFPAASTFKLGPEEYLEQIRKLKASLGIPIIASLNGTSRGSWLQYATSMEQAGADALELNVYLMAVDPMVPGVAIEEETVAMVKDIKSAVKIPVAVKLSPYYAALPHFVRQLELAGADGVVLFNRFYQPDIDIENLENRRELTLSDSSELLLRLRWLAILSGHTKLSLAASGGVHTPADALKAIMAGTDTVQVVSALLKRGPQYLSTLIQDTQDWLERHEYESLAQARGSMNLLKTPNPAAYGRANYVEILKSW